MLIQNMRASGRWYELQLWKAKRAQEVALQWQVRSLFPGTDYYT